MRVFIGLLFVISCSASSIATVDCGAGPIGGSGWLFAGCPGPIPGEPMVLAAVQTKAPLWPSSPFAITDFNEMGPGVRTRKFMATLGTSALAYLQTDFAVTFTAAGGGPGFFTPCLAASSTFLPVSGSFGGVSVTAGSGGSASSCSPGSIGPLLPFDSGVAQVLHAMFAAQSSQGLADESEWAFLVGFLVYDGRSNPVSAELTFEQTPEPSTLLLMGMGCLVLIAVRRRVGFQGVK